MANQPQTADELTARFDAMCAARPANRALVTRAENAEARAALTARAEAGVTVQGRDNRGCFTAGVKVFSTAAAKPAPARKVAKVEAPRPVWTPTEADIEAALAARQMGSAA